MGHEITICFPNETQKQNMREFLEKHIDLLEKIQQLSFQFKDLYLPFNTCLTESAQKPKALIFKRNTIFPIHFFEVAAWIAFQSGVRNKQQQPYFDYDGETALVELNPLRPGNLKVDSRGVALYTKKQGLMSQLYPNYNEAYEQIENLHIQWEAWQLQKKLTQVESKNRVSRKI